MVIDLPRERITLLTYLSHIKVEISNFISKHQIDMLNFQKLKSKIDEIYKSPRILCYNSKFTEHLVVLRKLFELVSSQDTKENLELYYIIHDLIQTMEESPLRNVIIHGMTQETTSLIHILNKNRTKVLCIIDENNEYLGKSILGIEILSAKYLPKNINDALVLICTNSRIDFDALGLIYGLPKEHFLYISEYLNNISDYNLFKVYYKVVDLTHPVKNFFTGLSYIETAIIDDALTQPSINAGVSGQDLYFDFEMTKYYHQILKTKRLPFFDNVLINLCHYSFDYRLSLCKPQRSEVYFSLLNTLDQAEHESEYRIEFSKSNEFSAHYFCQDYGRILFDFSKNKYQKLLKSRLSGRFNYSPNQVKLLEHMVKADFNKPSKSDQSRRRNKEILVDFIDYLIKNQANVYIVICPLSNIYKQFIDLDVASDFYHTLDQIKEIYPLEILDYSKVNDFNDLDFFDKSHLNRRGSNKFTRMINEVLIGKAKEAL